MAVLDVPCVVVITPFALVGTCVAVETVVTVSKNALAAEDQGQGEDLEEVLCERLRPSSVVWISFFCLNFLALIIFGIISCCCL